MITIILPGYSLHNKQWAYQTKEELEKVGLESWAYEWKHWTEGEMNITQEVENIVAAIGSRDVNIIAKSVGTKVFMKLLPKIEPQLNKVILCGIPFDPAGYLKGIKKIGPDKLIIFQNSKDPFMSYSVIKTFVKLIDRNVKVIRKESSTHEYPYFGDFLQFLSS